MHSFRSRRPCHQELCAELERRRVGLKPLHFADPKDRLRIEKSHVVTLEPGVDVALQNLLAAYSAGSDAANYLTDIMQVPVASLLVLDVEGMRDLVRKVERWLPSGDFYKKRKFLTQKEVTFKKLNKDLQDIFSYRRFATTKGWNLGELAKELNKTVKFCPYCNAETVYAYSVKKRGAKSGKDVQFSLVRSAFDHYFPKSRYPFLAVSLYNLIPACTRCNSGFKGDAVGNLLGMAHPYAELTGAAMDEDFHRHMKFDVVFKNVRALSHCTSDDLSAVVVHERIAQNFAPGIAWEKEFHLSESYSALYLEDAADAVWKAIAYPKRYLKVLSEQIGNAGLSIGNLERFLYGSRLDESSINRQRFGKMIIDLVETYRK